jgi:hypothetical protein
VERTGIDALIEHAEEQLEQVEAIYGRTLQEKKVSTNLQVRIKNVVENQRSALEYLAHGIYESLGDGKKANSYYPIAKEEEDFQGLFGRQLPGVAAKCSAVFEAIAAKQPYEKDFEWLRHLAILTNENKHCRLTPQTRTEVRRVRVDMPAGRVEWAPEGVIFGDGVLFGGVPVNPATQRPIPSSHQTVTDVIYVGWLFEEPRLPVLSTLTEIQESLPSLIDDLLSAMP